MFLSWCERTTHCWFCVCAAVKAVEHLHIIIKKCILYNIWLPLFALSFVYQVIVEKVSGSQIVDIDKRKYLVPSDITVAQFMWIIRKRIQLPSEKAIFLFVDKTVPQSRYSPALFITKTLLSTVPIKKYLTCPDLTMLISSPFQNTWVKVN